MTLTCLSLQILVTDDGGSNTSRRWSVLSDSWLHSGRTVGKDFVDSLHEIEKLTVRFWGHLSGRLGFTVINIECRQTRAEKFLKNIKKI